MQQLLCSIGKFNAREAVMKTQVTYRFQIGLIDSEFVCG